MAQSYLGKPCLFGQISSQYVSTLKAYVIEFCFPTDISN